MLFFYFDRSMVLQHFLQAKEKDRVVKREVKNTNTTNGLVKVSPISKKPCNGFFNEKFMIRGKLRVKQKFMVTDLTAPLNVGELRGYLALTQSTFL